MSMSTASSWVPGDSFSLRLLILRHELGLTQREAAKRCGLDDGSWSNWENGSHPRDMAKVVRQIHDATGVDMPWLMWGVMPAGGGSPTPLGDGPDTPPDLPNRLSTCIPDRSLAEADLGVAA